MYCTIKLVMDVFSAFEEKMDLLCILYYSGCIMPKPINLQK